MMYILIFDSLLFTRLTYHVTSKQLNRPYNGSYICETRSGNQFTKPQFIRHQLKINSFPPVLHPFAVNIIIPKIENVLFKTINELFPLARVDFMNGFNHALVLKQNRLLIAFSSKQSVR